MFVLMVAICTSPCQNGGTCSGECENEDHRSREGVSSPVAPNTCTCVTGYTGSVCQTRMFLRSLLQVALQMREMNSLCISQQFVIRRASMVELALHPTPANASPMFGLDLSVRRVS